MQARVVAGDGEGKSFWGQLGEMVDFQRALKTFADHVVGADGIAQIGVCLAQHDGSEPGQGRAVQAQLRLGVLGANAGGRQVMIDHRQAQAGKVGRAFQAAPLEGDDHWQVVGIGGAQAKLGVRRFESVGATQQVDTAITQGSDGLVTAVKTAYFNGYVKLFADDAGVVCTQPLIVMLTHVDFERGVVGARTAQYQALVLFQPVAVLAG